MHGTTTKPSKDLAETRTKLRTKGPIDLEGLVYTINKGHEGNIGFEKFNTIIRA